MEEGDRRNGDAENELIQQDQSESDEGNKSCINLCGLVSCITRQKKTKRRLSQREVTAVTQSPQNGLFIQISDEPDQEGEAVHIAEADAGICIKQPPKCTQTAVISSSHSSAKFFLPRVTSVTGGHQEAEERLLSRAVGRHMEPHTRFLTLRRLRRRKPPTRALQQYSALLDDIYHGPTKCALEKVGEWDFNAFVLDSMCGGRPVTVLCTFLLHYYGLLKSFDLDFASVWKCFSLIEDGYHSSNPYHNAIHAADVTQAMHCYLQEAAICSSLTPLELLAAIIAAVCHDLDHPGVNQPFLIATDNHLAVLYNNASVLENHHWRCAMGCLWESGILNSWKAEDVQALQEMIRSLILATDITRQNEFLSSFRNYLEMDTLDMEKAECRHFSLQIALKCADICNPCRPWDVCRHWAYKICDEFYRQGDYERQLKLPVTPLCDRQNNTVAKIQAGFIKFVVQPLFESWDIWLTTCLSSYMLSNLKENQCKWEQELVKEADSNIRCKKPINKHNKVEITVSTLSESSVSSNESEKSVLGSLQCMLHSLPLKRRHSLPVHASCFLPRTMIRRESIGGAGQPVLVYETISVGESPPYSAGSARSDYFFSESSSVPEPIGVARRQSVPLQSFSQNSNQALGIISPQTSLQAESSACIISENMSKDEEEKRKKFAPGCSNIGIDDQNVSEGSKSGSQKQSVNIKDSTVISNKNLDNNLLSENASLEPGTKREASEYPNLNCKKNKKIEQENLQEKLEGKLSHKKSNKENKPPDRSLWKKRLWKSLNHEDSYYERAPLLCKPHPQTLTNGRRGSAPVIRIEELRRFARVTEISEDYLSKRRGSAPNRIFTGSSSPVLARMVAIENERLTVRRGSAPVNGSLVCTGSNQIFYGKSDLKDPMVSGGGAYNEWDTSRLHLSQRENLSPLLDVRRSSYGFELLAGMWRSKYERSKPFLLSEDSMFVSSGSCTPLTPADAHENATSNYSGTPFVLPAVNRRGSLPIDVFICGETLISESDSS